MVSIGGSSGVSALLARSYEARGPKCAEVLSNCAGGDVEGGGEFFGGRFTTSFQGDENPALSCRGSDACCGHCLIVALVTTFWKFRNV